LIVAEMIFIPLLFLAGFIPPHDHRQEAVVNIATLDRAQAARLNGKWIRARIKLDSLPVEYGGFTVYDCQNDRDIYPLVYFFDGAGLEDENGPLIVEGKIQVIDFPAETIGTTHFPAFTLCRILYAKRVR
jgi:hypothetical protein